MPQVTVAVACTGGWNARELTRWPRKTNSLVSSPASTNNCFINGCTASLQKRSEASWDVQNEADNWRAEKESGARSRAQVSAHTLHAKQAHSPSDDEPVDGAHFIERFLGNGRPCAAVQKGVLVHVHALRHQRVRRQLRCKHDACARHDRQRDTERGRTVRRLKNRSCRQQSTSSWQRKADDRMLTRHRTRHEAKKGDDGGETGYPVGARGFLRRECCGRDGHGTLWPQGALQPRADPIQNQTHCGATLPNVGRCIKWKFAPHLTHARSSFNGFPICNLMFSFAFLLRFCFVLLIARSLYR